MTRIKRMLKSLLLYFKGEQAKSRLVMLLEDDEALVVVHYNDGSTQTKIAKVEGNLEKALKGDELAFLYVDDAKYLVHGKPDKKGRFHVYVEVA